MNSITKIRHNINNEWEILYNLFILQKLVKTPNNSPISSLSLTDMLCLEWIDKALHYLVKLIIFLINW